MFPLTDFNVAVGRILMWQLAVFWCDSWLYFDVTVGKTSSFFHPSHSCSFLNDFLSDFDQFLAKLSHALCY